MMPSLRAWAICFLLAVVADGHFLLDWPPSRGFNEDALMQYPCGGQNQVSSKRTSVPINSPFPVQVCGAFLLELVSY